MEKIINDKKETYIYTEAEYNDLKESYYALQNAYDSMFQINQELYSIILKLGDNLPDAKEIL